MLLAARCAHWRSCRHAGVTKPTTRAVVRTLDDLVSELGLKSVDFVKPDVDGYELEVLRGAPVALAAVAAFIAVQALGGERLFQHSQTAWLPNAALPAYDYLIGVLATLFIVGLANAPLPVPAAPVQRLIRFLAGTTFGLYLLHFPLLSFFGTVVPGPPERPTHGFLVFGLALVVAIALSHVIEQQKGPLKRALRSGLDLVRKRRLRPALERQSFP